MAATSEHGLRSPVPSWLRSPEASRSGPHRSTVYRRGRGSRTLAGPTAGSDNRPSLPLVANEPLSTSAVRSEQRATLGTPTARNQEAQYTPPSGCWTEAPRVPRTNQVQPQAQLRASAHRAEGRESAVLGASQDQAMPVVGG